jgi:PIN domain nuclease of toxin-antitoxin system
MAAVRAVPALLDASALIALLDGEPGAEVVEQFLADAAVLAVNLVEVVTKLARRAMPEAAIRAALEPLNLTLVPLTGEIAWRAGADRTRFGAGLGIADACCLAAAPLVGRVVVTTDRAWREAGPIFGADVIVAAGRV